MSKHLKYNPVYRDCRIFGHMWEPTTCTHNKKANSIEQHMRCRRCGSEKKFVLDRRGRQVRSSYSYDPRYQIKGHDPHDVRADMRKDYYGL